MSCVKLWLALVGRRCELRRGFSSPRVRTACEAAATHLASLWQGSSRYFTSHSGVDGKLWIGPARLILCCATALLASAEAGEVDVLEWLLPCLTVVAIDHSSFEAISQDIQSVGTFESLGYVGGSYTHRKQLGLAILNLVLSSDTASSPAQATIPNLLDPSDHGAEAVSDAAGDASQPDDDSATEGAYEGSTTDAEDEEDSAVWLSMRRYQPIVVSIARLIRASSGACLEVVLGPMFRVGQRLLWQSVQFTQLSQILPYGSTIQGDEMVQAQARSQFDELVRASFERCMSLTDEELNTFPETVLASLPAVSELTGRLLHGEVPALTQCWRIRIALLGRLASCSILRLRFGAIAELEGIARSAMSDPQFWLKAGVLATIVQEEGVLESIFSSASLNVATVQKLTPVLRVMSALGAVHTGAIRCLWKHAARTAHADTAAALGELLGGILTFEQSSTYSASQLMEITGVLYGHTMDRSLMLEDLSESIARVRRRRQPLFETTLDCLLLALRKRVAQETGRSLAGWERASARRLVNMLQRITSTIGALIASVLDTYPQGGMADRDVFASVHNDTPLPLALIHEIVAALGSGWSVGRIAAYNMTSGVRWNSAQGTALQLCRELAQASDSAILGAFSAQDEAEQSNGGLSVRRKRPRPDDGEPAAKRGAHTPEPEIPPLDLSRESGVWHFLPAIIETMQRKLTNDAKNSLWKRSLGSHLAFSVHTTICTLLERPSEPPSVHLVTPSHLNPLLRRAGVPSNDGEMRFASQSVLGKTWECVDRYVRPFRPIGPFRQYSPALQPLPASIRSVFSTAVSLDYLRHPDPEAHRALAHHSPLLIPVVQQLIDIAVRLEYSLSEKLRHAVPATKPGGWLTAISETSPWRLFASVTPLSLSCVTSLWYSTRGVEHGPGTVVGLETLRSIQRSDRSMLAWSIDLMEPNIYGTWFQVCSFIDSLCAGAAEPGDDVSLVLTSSDAQSWIQRALQGRARDQVAVIVNRELLVGRDATLDSVTVGTLLQECFAPGVLGATLSWAGAPADDLVKIASRELALSQFAVMQGLCQGNLSSSPHTLAALIRFGLVSKEYSSLALSIAHALISMIADSIPGFPQLFCPTTPSELPRFVAESAALSTVQSQCLLLVLERIQKEPETVSPLLFAVCTALGVSPPGVVSEVDSHCFEVTPVPPALLSTLPFAAAWTAARALVQPSLGLKLPRTPIFVDALLTCALRSPPSTAAMASDFLSLLILAVLDPSERNRLRRTVVEEAVAEFFTERRAKAMMLLSRLLDTDSAFSASLGPLFSDEVASSKLALSHYMEPSHTRASFGRRIPITVAVQTHQQSSLRPSVAPTQARPEPKDPEALYLTLSVRECERAGGVVLECLKALGWHLSIALKSTVESVFVKTTRKAQRLAQELGAVGSQLSHDAPAVNPGPLTSTNDSECLQLCFRFDEEVTIPHDDDAATLMRSLVRIENLDKISITSTVANSVFHGQPICIVDQECIVAPASLESVEAAVGVGGWPLRSELAHSAAIEQLLGVASSPIRSHMDLFAATHAWFLAAYALPTSYRALSAAASIASSPDAWRVIIAAPSPSVPFSELPVLEMAAADVESSPIARADSLDSPAKYLVSRLHATYLIGACCQLMQPHTQWERWPGASTPEEWRQALIENQGLQTCIEFLLTQSAQKLFSDEKSPVRDADEQKLFTSLVTVEFMAALVSLVNASLAPSPMVWGVPEKLPVGAKWLASQQSVLGNLLRWASRECAALANVHSIASLAKSRPARGKRSREEGDAHQGPHKAVQDVMLLLKKPLSRLVGGLCEMCEHLKGLVSAPACPHPDLQGLLIHLLFRPVQPSDRLSVAVLGEHDLERFVDAMGSLPNAPFVHATQGDSYPRGKTVQELMSAMGSRVTPLSGMASLSPFLLELAFKGCDIFGQDPADLVSDGISTGLCTASQRIGIVKVLSALYEHNSDWLKACLRAVVHKLHGLAEFLRSSPAHTPLGEVLPTDHMFEFSRKTISALPSSCTTELAACFAACFEILSALLKPNVPETAQEGGLPRLVPVGGEGPLATMVRVKLLRGTLSMMSAVAATDLAIDEGLLIQTVQLVVTKLFTLDIGSELDLPSHRNEVMQLRSFELCDALFESQLDDIPAHLLVQLCNPRRPGGVAGAALLAKCSSQVLDLVDWAPPPFRLCRGYPLQTGREEIIPHITGEEPLPSLPTDASSVFLPWSPFRTAGRLRRIRLKKPATNGFVGLVNQGNTCYQNSLLQQLFMIPRLRHAVLLSQAIQDAPSQPELVDDDLAGARSSSSSSASAAAAAAAALTTSSPVADAKWAHSLDRLRSRLQWLFSFLASSETAVVDPIPFVEACRNSPPGFMPLDSDVFEQNDANEFFSLLLDRLGQAFPLRCPPLSELEDGQPVPFPRPVGRKEDPDNDMMLSVFGGKFVHQIISTEDQFPFFSESREPFVNISVDVSQKASLVNSLKAFVAPDFLAGDNAYRCDAYGRKIDVKKRCAMAELPDTLVVHLKRFALDYETFQRTKVNDLLVFEDNLDMWPFTRQHMWEAEGLGSVVHGYEEVRLKQLESALELAPEDERAALKAELEQERARMAEWLSPPPHERLRKEDCQYRLRGVLVHAGTALGGHYYSFVKERPADAGARTRGLPRGSSSSSEEGEEGGWREFNDDVVREVVMDEVSRKAVWYGESDISAFMLFYDRVLPTPPPPPIETDTPLTKRPRLAADAASAEPSTALGRALVPSTGQDIALPLLTRQLQLRVFNAMASTLLSDAVGSVLLEFLVQGSNETIADPYLWAITLRDLMEVTCRCVIGSDLLRESPGIGLDCPGVLALRIALGWPLHKDDSFSPNVGTLLQKLLEQREKQESAVSPTSTLCLIDGLVVSRATINDLEHRTRSRQVWSIHTTASAPEMLMQMLRASTAVLRMLTCEFSKGSGALQCKLRPEHDDVDPSCLPTKHLLHYMFRTAFLSPEDAMDEQAVADARVLCRRAHAQSVQAMVFNSPHESHAFAAIKALRVASMRRVGQIVQIIPQLDVFLLAMLKPIGREPAERRDVLVLTNVLLPSGNAAVADDAPEVNDEELSDRVLVSGLYGTAATSDQLSLLAPELPSTHQLVAVAVDACGELMSQVRMTLSQGETALAKPLEVNVLQFCQSVNHIFRSGSVAASLGITSRLPELLIRIIHSAFNVPSDQEAAQSLSIATGMAPASWDQAAANALWKAPLPESAKDFGGESSVTVRQQLFETLTIVLRAGRLHSPASMAPERVQLARALGNAFVAEVYARAVRGVAFTLETMCEDVAKIPDDADGPFTRFMQAGKKGLHSIGSLLDSLLEEGVDEAAAEKVAAQVLHLAAKVPITNTMNYLAEKGVFTSSSGSALRSLRVTLKRLSGMMHRLAEAIGRSPDEILRWIESRFPDRNLAGRIARKPIEQMDMELPLPDLRASAAEHTPGTCFTSIWSEPCLQDVPSELEVGSVADTLMPLLGVFGNDWSGERSTTHTVQISWADLPYHSEWFTDHIHHSGIMDLLVNPAAWIGADESETLSHISVTCIQHLVHEDPWLSATVSLLCSELRFDQGRSRIASAVGAATGDGLDSWRSLHLQGGREAIRALGIAAWECTATPEDTGPSNPLDAFWSSQVNAKRRTPLEPELESFKGAFSAVFGELSREVHDALVARETERHAVIFNAEGPSSLHSERWLECADTTQCGLEEGIERCRRSLDRLWWESARVPPPDSRAMHAMGSMGLMWGTNACKRMMGLGPVYLLHSRWASLGHEVLSFPNAFDLRLTRGRWVGPPPGKTKIPNACLSAAEFSAEMHSRWRTSPAEEHPFRHIELINSRNSPHASITALKSLADPTGWNGFFVGNVLLFRDTHSSRRITAVRQRLYGNIPGPWTSDMKLLAPLLETYAMLGGIQASIPDAIGVCVMEQVAPMVVGAIPRELTELFPPSGAVFSPSRSLPPLSAFARWLLNASKRLSPEEAEVLFAKWTNSSNRTAELCVKDTKAAKRRLAQRRPQPGPLFLRQDVAAVDAMEIDALWGLGVPISDPPRYSGWPNRNLVSKGSIPAECAVVPLLKFLGEGATPPGKE
jgi:ubiquitin C-terminal hydrolase